MLWTVFHARRSTYPIVLSGIALTVFGASYSARDVLANGFNGASGAFLGAAVALAAYVAFLLLFALPKRLAKAHERRGSVSIRVSDDGLTFSNGDDSGTTGQTSWNAFLGYVSLKREWLLLYPGGKYLILPRRTLRPDEADTLARLLASHLKARGHFMD